MELLRRNTLQRDELLDCWYGCTCFQAPVVSNDLPPTTGDAARMIVDVGIDQEAVNMLRASALLTPRLLGAVHSLRRRLMIQRHRAEIHYRAAATVPGPVAAIAGLILVEEPDGSFVWLKGRPSPKGEFVVTLYVVRAYAAVGMSIAPPPPLLHSCDLVQANGLATEIVVECGLDESTERVLRVNARQPPLSGHLRGSIKMLYRRSRPMSFVATPRIGFSGIIATAPSKMRQVALRFRAIVDQVGSCILSDLSSPFVVMSHDNQWLATAEQFVLHELFPVDIVAATERQERHSRRTSRRDNSRSGSGARNPTVKAEEDSKPLPLSMAAAMVGRDAEAAEHAELVQSLAYAGVSPQERHRKRRKIVDQANGEQQRQKDEQLIADAVVSWERLRNTVQCLHLVNIEKVCSAEEFLASPVWAGDMSRPPAPYASGDHRRMSGLPWTAHDPELVFTSNVSSARTASGDTDESAAFNDTMSKVAIELIREVVQAAKQKGMDASTPVSVETAVVEALDDTESEGADKAATEAKAAVAEAVQADIEDPSPLPPALADSPAAGPAAAAASLITAAVAASLAYGVRLTKTEAWDMLPEAIRARCTSSASGGSSSSTATGDGGSRPSSRKRSAVTSSRSTNQKAVKEEDGDAASSAVAAGDAADGAVTGDQAPSNAPHSTTASEDGSTGSSRSGSRRQPLVGPSTSNSSSARSHPYTGPANDAASRAVLALSSPETPKWVVGSSMRSKAALSLWKTTSSVIAAGCCGANLEVPLVRPLSVSEIDQLRIRGGLGRSPWLGSRPISRFWRAVGPIVHVLRTRVGHLWTAGLIQLHSKEECQRMAVQAAAAVDPHGIALPRTKDGGIPDGLCFIRWSESYPGETAVSFSRGGEWMHYLCSPAEVGRRQLVDYLLSKADSDHLLLKWILRIHPDTNAASLHSFKHALSPYKSARTRAGKEAADAAATATMRRAERLFTTLVTIDEQLTSQQALGHLAAVRRLSTDAKRALTRASGVPTASSRQTLAATAITCAVQARAIAADVGVPLQDVE
jgi:hypothetical protein